MRNRWIVLGGIALIAASAMALQAAGSLLQGHAAALQKAEGYSARVVSISPGGGRVQSSVELAKPNFLRIDTPTTLTVADGEHVYTLYKSQNVFTKKPANTENLVQAMSATEFASLRPFFAADALAGLRNTRAGQPVNRRGQMLTPVSATLSDGVTGTFYINPADGLARQIELVETQGSSRMSTVFDFLDVNLARPAAGRFKFTAPEDAREVDEAELLAAKWFTNLDEALEVARRTNRPILLDFYTDWCVFCKKLDAEVFSTAEFKAKAASFVLVKINPEKDPGGTQGLEVEGFPTTFFLNARREVIHKVVGFKPVDLYIQDMETALSNNR